MKTVVVLRKTQRVSARLCILYVVQGVSSDSYKEDSSKIRVHRFELEIRSLLERIPLFLRSCVYSKRLSLRILGQLDQTTDDR